MDHFMSKLSHICDSLPVVFRTNNTNAIGAALAQQMAVTVGHDYSFIAKDLFSKNPEIAVLDVEIPQRPIQFGWMLAESKQTNPIIDRFQERFQYEERKFLRAHP